MNLPIEIYAFLERRLGQDDAMVVAKSIEASLSHIEERSREIALQRKLEAKEELRIELRNELTTKEDLARLEGTMKEDMARLESAVKEDMARLEGTMKEDMARLEGTMKEDMARLESAVKESIARLDKKFTVLWLTTIFMVIFVNKNALEFLASLLGLIK